jgi:hypothetical protein
VGVNEEEEVTGRGGSLTESDRFVTAFEPDSCPLSVQLHTAAAAADPLQREACVMKPNTCSVSHRSSL